MKWISWTLLGGLFLFGCTPNSNERVRFTIPWSQQGQEVRLQEVEATTLPNAFELSGQAARIYAKSLVSVSGETGTVSKPRLVKAQNGSYVPVDHLSLLAVSAYLHIERLMQLDQRTGVDGRLPWPRHITVEAKIYDARGVPSQREALYIGGTDSLVVSPYEGNGLAMALNGGVLAHEHFHAHFQRVVLNKLDASFYVGTSQRAMTNELIVRGWNEGLADFWGYVYSGDLHFVRRSLEHLQPGRRDLDQPLGRMLTVADLENCLAAVKAPLALVKTAHCRQGSYLLGSQVARFLVYFVHAVEARALTAGMPATLREKWGAFMQKKLAKLGAETSVAVRRGLQLEPAQVFLSLFEGENVLTGTHCGRLRTLVGDGETWRRLCGTGGLP